MKIRPLILLVILAVAGAAARADGSETSILRWQTLPDLPNPLGVAGAFAGVSGEAIIVAGGPYAGQHAVIETVHTDGSDEIAVLKTSLPPAFALVWAVLEDDNATPPAILPRNPVTCVMSTRTGLRLP